MIEVGLGGLGRLALLAEGCQAIIGKKSRVECLRFGIIIYVCIVFNPIKELTHSSIVVVVIVMHVLPTG